MTPKQVLLVEDEALLRSSLAQVLLACGYEVRGFSSGKAVLDLLQSDAPRADWALVIMDVHLDGDNGLEVQKKMRELGVRIPFIFMSAHQNAHDVNQAWRDGAHNFLFKPFSPDELLEAVGKAIAASTEVQATAGSSSDPDLLEKVKRLTPRQRQVLKWVANGLSNTQIAAHMGLSPRTVKMHRESMMHRFGFTHVADLVRFHDVCRHLL